MIANRELYYAGKNWKPGEQLDVLPEHARLFLAVKSAKLYEGNRYKRRDMRPEK